MPSLTQLRAKTIVNKDFCNHWETCNIYKKILFIIFLLYSFSVFSEPSRQCKTAFEKSKVTTFPEKLVDGFRAVVLAPITKGLAPSKLFVEDIMAIVSSVDYPQNQKAFIENHIKGKRVLEVASGGFTELSHFLLEAGAKEALSTDFVPLKTGQDRRLYLRGNIKRERVTRQVKEDLGGFADTTIITSVFGAIGYKEIEKWLVQLFIVTRPGGTVFLDFLLYERFPINITQEKFEGTLDSMKERYLIRSWKRAEGLNTFSYEYQTINRSRPNSVSYKLVIR